MSTADGADAFVRAALRPAARKNRRLVLYLALGREAELAPEAFPWTAPDPEAPYRVLAHDLRCAFESRNEPSV